VAKPLSEGLRIRVVRAVEGNVAPRGRGTVRDLGRKRSALYQGMARERRNQGQASRWRPRRVLGFGELDVTK